MRQPVVCGFHHREFERRGWTSVMINNIPHWRPPDWIDKHQTPLRKTYFDPARTTSSDATLGTPAIDSPGTDTPPKAPAAPADGDS
jgi:hypothetical protein